MSEISSDVSISDLSPTMAGNFSRLGDPLSSSLVSANYGSGSQYAPQYYEGDALSYLTTPRVDNFGNPSNYFSPVNYASFSDPFSFYVDNSYGLGMASGGMVDSEGDTKSRILSGVNSGDLDIRNLIDSDGYDSVQSAIGSMIDDGIPYASEVIPSGIDSVPGGTLDNIPAVVDGQTPVRLSTGEYVVPADVVKGIGGGSTESGAATLMQMVDEIRLMRGGKRVSKKLN